MMNDLKLHKENFITNITKGFISLIDRLYIYKIDNKNSESDILSYNNKLLNLTFKIIIFLFGGFLIWASFAPINSAAISIGNIAVSNNRKIIQHLEGGIIAKINIQEGSKVKKGEELVILNQDIALANIDQINTQLFYAKVSYARLLSEYKQSEELLISDDLLKSADNNIVLQEILTTQRHLFKNRQDVYLSKINIYDNKIEQLKQETVGLSKQISAVYEQLNIIKEEISMSQKLISTGHGNRTKLLDLQSKYASLEGSHGELIAKLAKVKQMIEETKLEKISYKQSYINEIISNIKEHQVKINEFEDKLYSAQDYLMRTTITSPIDGIVYGLKHHTIGGVISAGSEIMEIVPINEELQIETKIALQDIDIVYENMPVKIRLSAYKMKEIPLIDGYITYISADKFQTNYSNQEYYTAYVKINEESLNGIKNIKLQPGMPAELLLISGSRTMLQYLIYPIKSAMFKSLRAD